MTRRRDMAFRAYRDTPLLTLPSGLPVYESDLSVTPRERLRLLLGYAIGTLVVIGFVALMSLAGGT